MITKATQPTITTNSAGVPPAPPEALPKAVWVEIAKAQLQKHCLSGRFQISLAALDRLECEGKSIEMVLACFNCEQDSVYVGDTVRITGGLQAFFGFNPDLTNSNAPFVQIDIAPPVPLFALGRTVITPAALERLTELGQCPADFIRRHQYGDWSDMTIFDSVENAKSAKNDDRVFSSYFLTTDRTDDAPRVLVITEHDRSVTTVLLPSDY